MQRKVLACLLLLALATVTVGCSNPKAELEKLGITFDNESFFAAITRGDNLAVKLFLDAGMSLEIFDEQGLAPLHHAVGEKRIEIVRILLDRGA